MWVDFYNVRTAVTRATEEELAWLEDYLTFTPKDYRRAAEETSLLRQDKGVHRFPSGMLPKVRKEAEAKRIELLIADRRVRPCEPDWSADIAWLAEHQHESVRRICAETRGILKVATSGGKGDTAVATSKVLPCRWLFVAHRFSLVADIADRWEEHNPGARAGRIGESVWDEGDGVFVCATLQTLALRIQQNDPAAKLLVLRAQGLHFDEVHTAPGKQARTITYAARNAYWRVGLSGTPLDRSDKRSILSVAAIGPIIHTVTATQLYDAKFSSKCTVRMRRCSQEKVSGERWKAAYNKVVVNSAARNALVLRLAQIAEKPALLTFKLVRHGRAILKMLQRAGIRSDICYGKDITAVRKQKLKWLVREGDAVLVVNKVMQEGEVDKCLSQIRDIIRADAGDSAIVVNQFLGRGMRIDRAPDGRILKDEFTLWDIYDECPDEDPEKPAWHARQARARAKIYRKAGHRVLIED